MMNQKLFTSLILFLFAFTVAYAQGNLDVSGVTSPSGANGQYNTNGTLNGYDAWKHESGTYYIYNDGGGTWIIDDDTDPFSGTLFYSDPGYSSPLMVPMWYQDFGSGSPIVEEAAPVVSTGTASNVTSGGATLNGTVNANGYSTTVTFEYGLSTSYNNSVTADQSPVSGTSTTSVSYSLSGLSANTTYYYRTVASNAGGTTYGGSSPFTTDPKAATVTTEAVSGINATSATGNGTITDLGAPAPSEHGVCWNTSGSPTVLDNATDEGGASATGSFTSSISGLNPLTTYYVRAYAINTADTSYGAEVSFTTIAHFSGGGTSTDPYQITNLTDLGNLSEYEVYWDKHFVQMADIDAADTETWNSGTGFSPIGNASNRFVGAYHGKGHTIDSLTINKPSTSQVGLFGQTYYAKIDSLGITSVNIIGKADVGGLIGKNEYSEVTGCSSSGIINASYINVGGLIGSNMTGNVTQCYSSCKVSGDDKKVGGLIGVTQDNSSVTNCFSTGDVYRANGSHTSYGSFAGRNSNSTFNKCYSTGQVIYNNAEDPIDKGFVGVEDGSTSYSGNLIDTSASNQTSGLGALSKNTAEMQSYTTFISEGWDFIGETSNGTNDYWGLNDTVNGGYPFLSWQGFPHKQEDKIIPYLSVKDTTIFLDGTGSYILFDSYVVDSAWDNTVLADTSLSLSIFGCSDTGMQNIDVTVIDTTGNLISQTAVVTVKDTFSPDVICKDTTVWLDQNGIFTIASSFVNNGTTDACGIDTMWLSMYDFNCVDLGSNDVTLYARDMNGNVDSCKTKVTVQDSLAPSFSTVNPVNVYLDTSGNASLDPESVVVNASDNCSINDTTLSQSVFTCVDVGSVTIDVTVSDLGGNDSVEQVLVFVQDTLTPTISCVSDQVVTAESNGYYTVAGTEFDPEAIGDNCHTILSNDYNVSSSLAGAEIPVGDTIIKWIITDDGGNQDSCSFKVTVDPLVGMHQLADENILVYPSPTEGRVFIEAGNYYKGFQVEVLDMIGKVIMRKNLSTNSELLDLSGQPDGLYFVKIIKGSKVSVFEVIKK